MNPDNLLNEGWGYMGLVSEETLSDRLRELLGQIYRSVMCIETDEFHHLDPNRRYYNVLVRGWQDIPDEACPGGGFIAVAGRRANEPVDKDYIRNLTQILSQGRDNCRFDILVLPGPGFVPSERFRGQYVKDTTIDKVVWMRWDLMDAA